MNYEEFQHLARLFVVGALDDEEKDQFAAGRMAFGPCAEAFIDQCRKLNSVFALSLQPREPDPETKGKLMALIRATPRKEQAQSRATPLRLQAIPVGAFAFEGRVSGRN